MLLLVIFLQLASKRAQNVHCITALQTGAKRIRSFHRVVRYECQATTDSLKNGTTLESMGPNDSKARETKQCVVESQTYLTSFLEATSSAAAAVVIDIGDKYKRSST